VDAVSLYNDWFFEEEGAVAKRSAEVVIPWVLAETGAKTVIDIGCGVGAWLAVAKAEGCEVLGADGFAPDHMLLIDESEFRRVNIPCAFSAHWDLAICLEVAEHLPESASEHLVFELRQAPTVLFSAATPGQPGIGHINCQPHEFWHDLFAQYGKTPEFIGDKFTEPVADFYRRNMYLYR
jgi:hypothetical protein